MPSSTNHIKVGNRGNDHRDRDGFVLGGSARSAGSSAVGGSTAAAVGGASGAAATFIGLSGGSGQMFG